MNIHWVLVCYDPRLINNFVYTIRDVIIICMP